MVVNVRKNDFLMKVIFLVEGDGFEPSKSIDNRFTVCPLWPLGNPSAYNIKNGDLEGARTLDLQRDRLAF